MEFILSVFVLAFYGCFNEESIFEFIYLCVCVLRSRDGGTQQYKTLILLPRIFAYI